MRHSLRLFLRRLAPALLLAAALGAAAPAMAQPRPPAPPEAPGWARYASADEVQLRDVVAIVRITPQDRSDVAIIVTNPGPLPAPRVRVSGQRLVVDGRLRRRIRDCDVEGPGSFEVQVGGVGRLSADELPRIELRVPREAVVSADGAYRLRLGRSAQARVRLAGCGDADIEGVENELDLAITGAPDVRVYDVGSAQVAIAGAGDVTLGAVRGGLTVSLAGAGDVVASHVSGPTNIAVQGAGDVTIRGGRADPLTILVAGVGDVTYNGVAASLNATVLGAGDVRVRRVEGAVNQRVLGSGEVLVSQR